MVKLYKPKFWQSRNLVSIALLPITLIYIFFSGIRPLVNRQKKFQVPIICIGNNVIGGTGKTPTVIEFAKILQRNKYKPAIISKGYKGILTKIKVNKNVHSYVEVGEEPLLLSDIAPTYIAKKRSEAIDMAIEDGANIILLDDGLQDPSIYKDLSFAVFDSKYGIGNGFVLPSGPLRESVGMVKKKTDYAVIVGNDIKSEINQLLQDRGFEVVKANIAVKDTKLIDSKSHYIAFAGIGSPNKFYDSLRDLKLDIVKTVDFPDHHFYTDTDLNKLVNLAEKLSARLITTEKDFIKIPEPFVKKIDFLPIEIKFENKNQIIKYIKNINKKNS